MLAYQGAFSLDAIQDYFAHLNPIAQRIASDISDTKSTYGQLWFTLNPNEQNDIINEVLIKPEVTLRYFENFSSSSSSSPGLTNSDHSLRSASADSLAALVLKNINISLSSIITHTKVKNAKQAAQGANKRALKTIPSDVKIYYGYDGRNLRTYALQKVALKIIHDDVLGLYRDEHSAPFSYHTRSQINLHLWNISNSYEQNPRSGNEGEICLLNNINDEQFPGKNTLNTTTSDNYEQTISNYKRLQNELKKNISIKKICDNIATNYKQLENFHETSFKLLTDVSNVLKNKSPSLSTGNPKTEQEPKIEVTNYTRNESGSETLVKASVDTTTANSTPPITYAIYTDAYFELEESSKLMMNCSNSGNFTSSSSATTSEDERDDHVEDEKTVCEDVNLLDNDINLRKGFDFLNNW